MRFKTKIFVYLMVKNGSQMLLMKRKNTGHHDGLYSLPSGHLEKNESLTNAVIREALEEIGITPNKLKMVYVLHRKEFGETCIDVFFTTDSYIGSIENKEPDKCEKLSWVVPLYEIIPYINKVFEDIDDGITYGEYGWN